MPSSPFSLPIGTTILVSTRDPQWPGHRHQQIGRICGINWSQEQVGADLVEVSQCVVYRYII